MNYAQLTATIKGYAENDFPETVDSFTSAEQIATFVQQAEQRIYNNVQILALRKNVTGFTTADNKYLSTPVDWLANFSLAVIDPVTGEYEYLLDKDVNFIRQSFPFPSVTGKPTHYAYWDENSFILGPTPDATYQMELHYFYYPESIVTAGTTWLGDNFDSALLNGTIYEAALYMRMEQDSVKLVSDRYVQAIALLKNLGDGKQRMDAYRDGQVRVQVS